jgi:hypothetical protein
LCLFQPLRICAALNRFFLFNPFRAEAYYSH